MAVLPDGPPAAAVRVAPTGHRSGPTGSDGGAPIGWPRGENEAYIFTAGNARPLDQALQHAATEMVRWLERDWRLDVVAANTLLGLCLEYDVGNVFDPAYTMICKLPKRVLRQVAEGR